MPADQVWTLVSDPHHLPRWWPLTARVEDVQGTPGAAGLSWTKVLRSDRGAQVRADFRCVAAEPGSRFGWEQDIAGTPFERILRDSSVEVAIRPRDAGSEVRVTATERLRGLSRLGSVMMRTAARRRLDEALDGIERALVGEPASPA